MKKYFLLLFWGLSIILSAQNYCLDVPLITKAQGNWCGIASTKCVLDYYGFDEYRQCDLAEYVRTDCPWTNLGYYNCCTNPSSCNSSVELLCLQDILTRFGNIKTMPILGTLEYYGIQNWLKYQRPPIMKWENKNDPTHGHAMVIYEIKEKPGTPSNWVVSVMDPDPIDNNLEIGGFRQYYIDELKEYYNQYTGITFKWTLTFVPHFSPHCYNGVPDADETGTDCGGISCPSCPPPPSCSNCHKDPGEEEMDCGGDNCRSCDDVPIERNISNSTQLRKEVAAFNKITAKGNVVVQTGKNVSFITNNEGTIVLLPGFKAENGCIFTTQRKDDLSDYDRGCGTICGKSWIPTVCYSIGDNQGLYIHDLQYALKIDYEIYDLTYYNKKYKNVKEISNNGTIHLWNCISMWENVTYRIFYDIYHCDGSKRGSWQDFTVIGLDNRENFSNDDPAPPFSPPANNITLPNEIPAPNFSIIPNPNPGTFQLETNFSLSDIANFKITNSLGAPVYETQNLFSNTIQLPTSTSGLHFVVAVLKDGTVLTQKMMLQR